jgi:hypothetical protein
MNTLNALYFNVLWYTQANLFGIGSIVNMTISDMDPVKALQLSDICWDSDHNYMVDPVSYSTHNDAQKEPYYSVSGIMANNDLNNRSGNYIIHFTDEQDYIDSNNKLNLFGLLPWDAVVLKTDDGKYVYKTFDGMNDKILFNPLRKEVLTRKSISILIVGASIYITYKLTKYSFNKLKKLI